MKKAILIILMGFSTLAFSQDSTLTQVDDYKVKRQFSHEIGFNGVLLIKQLINSSSSTTIAQLPYQVGYTLGFGNKNGMRIGVGYEQTTINTSIQGQNTPRTSNFLSGSYRLDYCRNVIEYKKISCSAFLGGIYDQSSIKTTTITDQTSFGGPLIKSELTGTSNSFGGEIGLIVRYSFNKHIGVSIEAPLQVKITTTKETDKQTVTSGFSSSSYTETITNSDGMSSKIYVPTSVFIFVKF